jgi:hypothetical protein
MNKTELIEVLRENEKQCFSLYELAVIVGSSNNAIIGKALDGSQETAKGKRLVSAKASP